MFAFQHHLCPFGCHLADPFSLFFPQMATKDKLITQVLKEEPGSSRNKVTVVGVGMVGMATAMSVLLKVRDKKITQECVQ